MTISLIFWLLFFIFICLFFKFAKVQGCSGLDHSADQLLSGDVERGQKDESQIELVGRHFQ